MKPKLLLVLLRLTQSIQQKPTKQFKRIKTHYIIQTWLNRLYVENTHKHTIVSNIHLLLAQSISNDVGMLLYA